jgi:hypothetical protein
MKLSVEAKVAASGVIVKSAVLSWGASGSRLPSARRELRIRSV